MRMVCLSFNLPPPNFILKGYIMKIYPPTFVSDDSQWVAQNNPWRIRMSTAVTPFSAIWAQEAYEGRQNFSWIILPLILLAVLALLFSPFIFILWPIWIVVYGSKFGPIRAMREQRELKGQSIEIAARNIFYGEDVESEVQRQGAHIQKYYSENHGYFIGWTAQQVKQGLRDSQPEARDWVFAHQKAILKMKDKYG